MAVDVPTKSLEEVPSKKRAMYRRRYELLDSLTVRIAEPAVEAQPGSTELAAIDLESVRTL